MAEARTYRTDDGLVTLGMRGSHNWTADEAPDSYREMILYLYPNGAAPLTAMLSKLKNVKEDNPHFHWFTKGLATRSGAVTGVYTDSALTAALGTTTNITDSMTLYVKMAEADANIIRVGHQLQLSYNDANATYGTQIAVDVTVRVVGVVKNGASSYVTVMTIVPAGLLTTLATNRIAEYNRFIITGSINPEASTRPSAILQNAVEYGNYQQIFRTAMTISRNAQIKNRLGDPYQNMKKDTLEEHSIDMEWAFLTGMKGWRMGDNGMPERTTGGIIPFLKENASSNVIDCYSAAGLGWDNLAWGGTSGYGLDALEYIIRTAFTYGNSVSKPAFVGAGALAAIQNAVRGNAQYNISRGEASYGIKVTTLESVFGTLNLIKHPLWTLEPTMTNSMLVFEPSNLEFRYCLDTKFEKDDRFGKGGGDGLDGIVEGFITEAGLSIHHPQTFVYAANLGLAHVNE